MPTKTLRLTPSTVMVGKILHHPACHWLLHWRSVEREAPAFETAAANDERVRLINAIQEDFN